MSVVIVIVAMLLLFAPMAVTAASALTAEADFAARCNAALATGGRCFGFDSSADLPVIAGQDHCWGCNFGAFAPSAQLPVIDTSMKASGGGSMKFVTPPGSGSGGGGSWFTNFSNPASTFQLGEGQEVWVQYRYRPDANTLNNANNPTSVTSPGFKLSMVGTGDTPACSTTPPGQSTVNCPGSCSDMETVVNPARKGSVHHLQVYTTCGSPIGQPPLSRDIGGANFDFHPNWTGTPTRSCLYNGGSGPFGPANCFNFRPNEWHTIKYHIKIGTWNTWSSTIQVWAAHEGEPLQLLVNCSPGVTCTDNAGSPRTTGWFLYNSNPAVYKMGKVWLLPYMTSATGPILADTVWYDELIISKADIADPGMPSSGIAPSAPCCLTLTQLSPVALVVLGVILLGRRRWRWLAPRGPHGTSSHLDERVSIREDGQRQLDRSHDTSG